MATRWTHFHEIETSIIQLNVDIIYDLHHFVLHKGYTTTIWTHKCHWVSPIFFFCQDLIKYQLYPLQHMLRWISHGINLYKLSLEITSRQAKAIIGSWLPLRLKYNSTSIWIEIFKLVVLPSFNTLSLRYLYLAKSIGSYNCWKKIV